jgi:hypothetical protein
MSPIDENKSLPKGFQGICMWSQGQTSSGTLTWVVQLQLGSLVAAAASQLGLSFVFVPSLSTIVCAPRRSRRIHRNRGGSSSRPPASGSINRLGTDKLQTYRGISKKHCSSIRVSNTTSTNAPRPCLSTKQSGFAGLRSYMAMHVANLSC